MSRFRRAMLWAVMAAILLLAVLSICGAFLGADRAQAFFNSLPLVVYWFAAIALLAAGIVVFRRLLRVPSLLAMHLGCILVLLGAMWGSKPGHTLQKQLFGIDKIPHGELDLLGQTDENRVQISEDKSIRELPFHVRLRDYREEYYEPGQLLIWSRDGRSWRLPAKAGQALSLGGDLGAVTIRRVYRNFRIDIENGQRVTYDVPGDDTPALEVDVEKPGTQAGKRYVFAWRPAHMNPDSSLAMSYHKAVRDYISELEIVEGDQVVAAKEIEVNHPLHYGGYHLYQYKPGGEDEYGNKYTGLLVVSDSGLNAVYGGYALLIGGVFWHFWGRRALTWFRTHYVIAARVPGEAR
ncbi:MAG: cytochrome c biogenesis protein ResB [Phycisphaerae bacterium]|nr:cytochrome c biogenesis protein ResB [Phycisphaerae bacterium]